MDTSVRMVTDRVDTHSAVGIVHVETGTYHRSHSYVTWIHIPGVPEKLRLYSTDVIGGAIEAAHQHEAALILCRPTHKNYPHLIASLMVLAKRYHPELRKSSGQLELFPEPPVPFSEQTYSMQTSVEGAS